MHSVTLKRANVVNLVELREPNNLVLSVCQPTRFVLPIGLIQQDVQIEGVIVRQIVLSSTPFYHWSILAEAILGGECNADVLLLVKGRLWVHCLFLLLLLLKLVLLLFAQLAHFLNLLFHGQFGGSYPLTLILNTMSDTHKHLIDASTFFLLSIFSVIFWGSMLRLFGRLEFVNGIAFCDATGGLRHFGRRSLRLI